ncbi:hypothetical protein SDC9_116758 [bioreactor metagenome]|uniref:Uncharacterized protein n=1 Tax=bioreactor metagenome TaxID=1076179 RepID=A0A645BWI2_9ZZZZ
MARRIQITNLIEKDSTLVGHFKTPCPIGCCIGESPFLVPKHFTLEKALRDTAQVHFHKVLLCPRTVHVNGLGNQFLSRATFTGNENRRIGFGNSPHHVEHIHQRRRFTYYIRAQKRCLGRCILFLLVHFRCQLQRCFNALQQSRVVPRFGDKIKSTRLHSLHCQLNTSPSRHQYDRHLRIKDLDLFQQYKPLLPCGGERKVHVH